MKFGEQRFWSAMGKLVTTAIQREKTWCEMCRMGILPGHGHIAKDGTKDEALIRWA